MVNLYSYLDYVILLSICFSYFFNFVVDFGQENYDVVVVIDFGILFSGFVFLFNYKDGSDEIYMNREWGSV